MNPVDGNDMDISIVLCRVTGSGNVGSICRAMKSMGVGKLILADCPRYEDEEVRAMAVHAYDVFEKARRFETLEPALGEFSLTAGFSRRRGEKRKERSESIRDFVAGARQRGAAPLALVFGNEKDGLSDRELSLCGLAVHIPTSGSCPSLNVAQAVQIACYEFFASVGRVPSGHRAAADPATRKVVDSEVAAIAETLSELGFFRKSDDSYARRFLRDLCERAGASAAEVDYLKRLFLKTGALSSRPPSDRT
ncbi:MAG TPA: RNA methyltransferase [Rectinemataceae bacterium]|nr:RNA methyltransferase [Rectinemataceae bacterium]